MADDDAQIIARVLGGATDDYRLFVERYQASIFRLASHMVGDRHEAEDLTQEAFLAAFANLAAYVPGRAAFGTWLFTIARNRCLNHLQRKSTRSAPKALDADQAVAEPQRESSDLLSQLDQALAELPLEQRTALVLAEIEGLSYAEIADIQQTSLGTIKSRIHRAKERMRNNLLRPPRSNEASNTKPGHAAQGEVH